MSREPSVSEATKTWVSATLSWIDLSIFGIPDRPAVDFRAKRGSRLIPAGHRERRSYGSYVDITRYSPGITRLSRCSRNRSGFISPSTRDSGSSMPSGVKNTSAGRPRMLYCSMIAWLSALISVMSTR